MTKQVVVKVSKLGDVKIDAEGFVGESCLAATQAIEQMLSGEAKRTLKPEFDQAEASQEAETENLRF